jgi:hypothetical protein
VEKKINPVWLILGYAISTLLFGIFGAIAMAFTHLAIIESNKNKPIGGYIFAVVVTIIVWLIIYSA